MIVLKNTIKRVDKFKRFIKEKFYSFTENHIKIKFTHFSNIPIDLFYKGLNDNLLENKEFRTVEFSPDIEFFSVFGDKNSIIKSKAKAKIFFTGECTSEKTVFSNFSEYKDNCTDIVDLSLGFDYNLKDNYLRFPLWLLYYFELTDDLDTINKKVKEFNNFNFKKTKFCSLIASHDLSGYRGEVFKVLNNIEKVDCPGKLFHNDNNLKTVFSNNKIEYLKNYKFNICPENTQSEGYVTEKLFEALEAGCIPIYNGWSRDPEPNVINSNSFLWYDMDGNNEGLIDKINFYNNNEDVFNTFKKQNQPFLKSAPDTIHSFIKSYNEKLENILLNVTKK